MTSTQLLARFLVGTWASPGYIAPRQLFVSRPNTAMSAGSSIYRPLTWNILMPPNGLPDKRWPHSDVVQRCRWPWSITAFKVNMQNLPCDSFMPPRYKSRSRFFPAGQVKKALLGQRSLGQKPHILGCHAVTGRRICPLGRMVNRWSFVRKVKWNVPSAPPRKLMKPCTIFINRKPSCRLINSCWGIFFITMTNLLAHSRNHAGRTGCWTSRKKWTVKCAVGSGSVIFPESLSAAEWIVMSE